MKKKDAVQKGIDDVAGYSPELDYSYDEKQKELFQKKKDDARPALLKRIGAGILDFLMAAGLAAGFFGIAYFAIFPSVGYQAAAGYMINTYETSGLYYPSDTGSGYVPLTEKYDDDKTPEENYDVKIKYFYSNNARAVIENQAQLYLNRKLDSGYYYLNENNECERKNTVPKDTAKAYLEKEYNLAIDYLFNDPQVIQAVKVLNYTIPVTILITAVLGCAVFYFAIPLIDEKRRTLGYMILRIMPVTSDKMTKPTRSAIALRSLIFVVIDYISLITIGLILGGTSYSFIPFFLNTVILCLSHSNSGIHDFGAKIIVINESMTNAMSSMQQMLGQDDEEERKYELPTSK